MSAPMDRLKQLESIEKDIASALQSGGQAILELSKEKPSMKQVDTHTSTFLKTLENVENSLSKHITYLTQVSTGQAHEGSSYATQKVMHMAWHRLEHARSRLTDLERIKNQHQQASRQSALRQQPLNT
ncbi:mediator of RNA polymerase II transcription subunit 11 [Centruroides vittatus]|uniref:mediator of RNA polymerase II transcription subunit 11-like n=1 Tax=Centruroides sculpturatus TaxID=218467 RepID=UPI000C6DD846|nr:mediator of RNA polymerase II transcription subunit 11-like [Centruroides sculpturatus]